MLISLLTVLVAVASATIANGIDTFANVTVYDPGTTSRVSYARTANLPNDTILAVWSDPSQVNSTIPVYRSTDNGFSWRSWGSVSSDQPNRKLLQPHILYVNGSFGEEGGDDEDNRGRGGESSREGESNRDGTREGDTRIQAQTGVTVLAVNAVDDKSTNIEIYASWDNGESWQFQSRVATGGPANTTNGATPVWEPFLLYHGDLITVYYSDSRDPQHAQKLSHQTTMYDLDSWGSAIDDASFQTYTDRPGMTTVAKLPNGQYILTFEYAKLDASNVYHYPIYYKLSSSPENFASEPPHKIVVDTGAQPNGGPYVTWSPLGGTNGTIVVSDSDSNAVFVNQALGQGIWKQVNTTAGRAYSREIQIPDNDNTKLRFACGAEYKQETPSQILITIMDLEKALGLSK